MNAKMRGHVAFNDCQLNFIFLLDVMMWSKFELVLKWPPELTYPSRTLSYQQPSSYEA